MARRMRLIVPAAVLCFSTLLAGCVVVPPRGHYRPAYYAPAYHGYYR